MYRSLIRLLLDLFNYFILSLTSADHLRAVKSHSDANIRRKMRANSLITSERPLRSSNSSSEAVPARGNKSGRRYSTDVGFLNSGRQRTQSDGALKHLMHLDQDTKSKAGEPGLSRADHRGSSEHSGSDS
jgi:hypothetical protein